MTALLSKNGSQADPARILEVDRGTATLARPRHLGGTPDEALVAVARAAVGALGLHVVVAPPPSLADEPTT